MRSDVYLDTSGMETRCPVFRCTTSLDIVCLRLIFDDDERMLELTSCLYIHAEICLERICYLHSFWYIEKCPTTPYSAMKRREHMVPHRDCPHKMTPDEVFMIAYSHRHILEYHSLLFEFFAEIMIDDFTIILSTDSCEHSTLSLWDTESVKCIFYRFWDIIP
jgi:hypothetical protein